MPNEIEHNKTVIDLSEFNKDLTYCWVCRRTLSIYGGAPDAILNSHHVIPQAFGGREGPTVSLDSSHHDLLHAIALRLITRKDFRDLTTGLTQDEYQRIMYLATRVQAAEAFSRGDPNKRVKLTFGVTNQVNDQLKRIAQFKNISKENVVIQLIDEAHRHLFPSKKKSN